MNSCTNCEEDISEGFEVFDDEGNPFCCQDHLERFHK